MHRVSRAIIIREAAAAAAAAVDIKSTSGSLVVHVSRHLALGGVTCISAA